MRSIFMSIRKPIKKVPLSNQVIHSLALLILGFILGYFIRFLDLCIVIPGSIFSRIAIWILICSIVAAYSSTPFRAACNSFILFISIAVSYKATTNITTGELEQCFLVSLWICVALSPLLGMVAWYAKGKGRASVIMAASVVVYQLLLSAVLFPVYAPSDLVFGILTLLLLLVRIKKEPGEGKSLKASKVLLIYSMILFAFILFYVGLQFFKLKLYVGNEQIEVPELTAQQKEEDFRYLAGYVRDCYPYASMVEEYKGLYSIEEQEEMYIKRAGETKDNLEFLQLFLEYAQQLGQAGHYGIQWLREDSENLSFCYMFGIPKDAFYKTEYWSKLSSKLDIYVHSDLQVAYQDGRYQLQDDYQLGDQLFPKDTVLLQLNGMPVDDYVLSLQDKQVLRLDTFCNKVYAENIFLNRPDDCSDAWSVEFLLPNQEKQIALVPMIPGYPTQDINVANNSNVICWELNEQTGYLKINTFLQEHIESDKLVINNFLNASYGKYTKLIIDVRGNMGGEPSYWMENLIGPLLKEPVQYSEVTAVKKSYFLRMNLRYSYYRLTATNHLLKQEKNHISHINTTSLQELDPKQWMVYEIERNLIPTDSFPFNGEVYVLCDGNTLSAGDSFVRAVQETGIGTVAGTNTLGWGDIFMQPNICALPNSGLMLRMDIEMPICKDGTIDSISGVNPDVNLSPSTYPTPYPVGYDKESLLQDEWIQWVLKQ